MSDKQKRYEQLRDHFNDVVANGGTVSDAESNERIRLHYELTGIAPVDFDVPVVTSSSDPANGLNFIPKGKGKHTAR